MRSLKKGPFVDPSLMRKYKKVVSSGKRSLIQTWSRSSTILPDFIGMTFSVHNGKNFIKLLVSEHMVNRKFGEFVPTRTYRDMSSNKVAKKGK